MSGFAGPAFDMIDDARTSYTVILDAKHST